MLILQKLWDEVIKDCDEAIARDERYQKAYTRRGKAKLALKQYPSALEGLCGLCFYKSCELSLKRPFV